MTLSLDPADLKLSMGEASACFGGSPLYLGIVFKHNFVSASLLFRNDCGWVFCTEMFISVCQRLGSGTQKDLCGVRAELQL